MELKPVCMPVREAFCLEWKISNLRHWSEEVHGQSLLTTVDFDHGLRVEFRLFKGGEMMLFFPPELRRYEGHLVIRGADDHVYCSMEKRENLTILHFEKCEGKLGDHCVLFIKLENACNKLRCEYATTVLQPLSLKTKLGALLGNHVMRRQRHFCRPQRQDPLNSNREPQLVRQQIPSLESLAIGQESNQPSRYDLPSIIQVSMEDRVSTVYSLLARRRRRLHNFLQRPTIQQQSTDLSTARLATGQWSNEPLKNDLPSTIQWSMDEGVSRLDSALESRMRRLYPSLPRRTIEQPTDLSTTRPTHEQLIPGLGSLSISREVEASSSDQPSRENIRSSEEP